ncbi:MAG: winged helix-turn-helix domain-containing protein, partial [Anaerolineaceae bacterium]|nr:winged helix-turn-helix domain-containing protein [Anaerolineaceae bacterium]
MATWDEYPADYRKKEITRILTAVRAGECVSVIGLSGAGKSNLMGFLAGRCGDGDPQMVLVDGNRAQPRSASGLFRLARQAFGNRETAADEFSALDAAATGRLQSSSKHLSLLFDRYDAIGEEEQQLAAGPLRALRDANKYQLTYILATRRPLNQENELAELFYAHTIWLGPLSQADGLWSAGQYAARRGITWDEAILTRLYEISWGYPSLLRACCEAYADGAPLEPDALRSHPILQRRVKEFWADQPSAEDLRHSGISGLPLLGAVPTRIQANSPDLTASEHHLLAFFQAHPGDVCAKDDLIRAVWPEDRVSDGLRDDSLAQLVRRLRQKIEADPAKPQHIVTIPGRGYRYVA